MSPSLVKTKDFDNRWPGVTEDMKDFVHIELLRAGDWKKLNIRLSISRDVPIAKLQPHVQTLKTALSSVRKCQVSLLATEQPSHRVELEFWR